MWQTPPSVAVTPPGRHPLGRLPYPGRPPCPGRHPLDRHLLGRHPLGTPPARADPLYRHPLGRYSPKQTHPLPPPTQTLPLDRHPPPGRHPQETATEAGGAHPTRMHSCYVYHQINPKKIAKIIPNSKALLTAVDTVIRNLMILFYRRTWETFQHLRKYMQSTVGWIVILEQSQSQVRLVYYCWIVL